MARGVHVRVGRRRGSFYFAPGHNPTSHLAELWTTDGVTCAKVWEDPTGGNRAITHLAHATATGKLYIFCDDFDAGPWTDFGVDVFALDPATNAVAHFGGPYEFGESAPSGFGNDQHATHAAEYAGALYVAHAAGRGVDGSYVARLDLATGAVALVAQADGQARVDLGAGVFAEEGITGGLGVVGPTLYWTDGVAVWSGTGGGLARRYYLGYADPSFPSDIDGMGCVGSPVSFGGEWYFPGQYAGDETSPPPYGYAANVGIQRTIRRSDNSVEFIAASDPRPFLGGAFYNRTACVSALYDVDDATPLQLFALDDGFGAGGTLNVWKRDPVSRAWSSEIDLHAFNGSLQGMCCSMKSLKGEMLVLAASGFPSRRTSLFKRAVGGAWSLLRDFAGYVPPTRYNQFAPVARVSAVVKCHEM